uniref:Uncharacterized protein n=1 Tax=Siphoviridae sp. ctGa111 TaxID=2825413 RepID=A0A8S5VDB0_9CAUD|nr:MAG TPA: hypothetical protein [Siphoviridae sp. ctGa111]
MGVCRRRYRGVFLECFVRGKYTPGWRLERVEKECRDGIDRRNGKGWDDGR